MKVSGFTIIRNGVSFDYPFLESMRSLLPCVDELIVNVGSSQDETLQRVHEFSEREGQGKVKIFETFWPMDQPEKKRGGLILSEQTNLALERCSGDWCLYLQGDEVLHEQDYLALRASMQRNFEDREVEGLLFDYVHFYGSFDIIQVSRSSYRREVRALRRSSGPLSVGDAQSFRKADGSKLRVASSGARIFHYGWVRLPEKMREKTYFLDQLYHGENPASEERVPYTGENYKYKKIWGLRGFHGTHPLVMRDRILKKNWNWDFKNSPLVWTWGDLKKITLDLFERFTGKRLFEYKSYILVQKEKESNLALKPRISLFVATYEMPRHLELVMAGIERQSFRDFEVLVCDDGSGKETAKVIAQFKENSKIQAKHLWQEHQGFRKCRILNQALRKAEGDVFVFLDGDCIPHRDFLKDHFYSQENGRYLCGRRVELGPKFTERLTPEKIRNGILDRPFSLLLSFLSGDSDYWNRSFRIPWEPLRKLFGLDQVVDLKGCNYSASRQAIEAINGFDEEYEGYGREDTDVELRLKNLGLKIKSLKGLAIQFHLWHPRREFTPANDSRLEDLKKSGRIRCSQGLFQSPS